MQIMNANSTFLTVYHHHVIEQWKSNYFSYDGLRGLYKEIKHGGGDTDVSTLELALDLEIKRVRDFTDSCINDFENKLDDLKDDVDKLLASKNNEERKPKAKKKKLKDDEDDDELFGEEKIIDGMIREVYRESNEMSAFLELNLFAISKIAKKFRKVFMNRDPSSVADGIDIWTTQPSYASYTDLLNRGDRIRGVLGRLERVYCSAFRATYPELAHAELHFDKDKHQQLKRNRIGLGAKFGIILCLVSCTLQFLQNWPSFILFVAGGFPRVYRYR
jgi:hypothetical protein